MNLREFADKKSRAGTACALSELDNSLFADIGRRFACPMLLLIAPLALFSFLKKDFDAETWTSPPPKKQSLKKLLLLPVKKVEELIRRVAPVDSRSAGEKNGRLENWSTG